MRRCRRFGRSLVLAPVAACAALALVLPVLLLAPGVAAQQSGVVKLEWFGWSFFRFTSPTGKVILTNPFIRRCSRTTTA